MSNNLIIRRQKYINDRNFISIALLTLSIYFSKLLERLAIIPIKVMKESLCKLM
jgi:hypothetical protein